MYHRIIPLFFCLILLLLVSSTQVESADSVLLQQNEWVKQDNLVSWAGSLKSQSQELRSEGRIQESIDLLTKCIDSCWRAPENDEEFKLFGWIHVNRAYLFDQKQGDFLAAKDDYLSGLELFESCGYNDILVAMYLLHPLGNIYTRLGENEQAIEMLQGVNRICKKEAAPEVLMNSYNDLGRAYVNKEEFSIGLDLYEEGMAVDRENMYMLGLLESSKAEAELYAESYDDGIRTAESSLAHLTQAFKKLTPSDYQYEACGRYISGVYSTLGELLLKKGAYKRAKEQFQQGIDQMDQFYVGKHRRRAKLLNGLGDCFCLEGDYQQGLKTYQQALIGSIEGFDIENVQVNPERKLLFAESVIGEALIGKARAANKAYQTTNNLDLLELSMESYRTYFLWVKRLRAEHLNLQSKLELGEKIHAVGEEALTVVFELQEQEEVSRASEIAFEFMEQTKGIILSESFTINQVEGKSNDLKKLLKKIDELRMQRSLFKISLTGTEQKEEDEVRRLQSGIEQLDRKIQLLNFQLRKDFPSYDRLKIGEDESINFSGLKKHLGNNNIKLLSYFVGERSTYLIEGSESSFTFVELEKKEFEEALSEFMTQLNNPRLSTPMEYEKAGGRLTKLLLGESISDEKNLLILPDGNLNLLPFEALTLSDGRMKSSFKSIEYLVKSRAIHYAPSIKFVLQNRDGSLAQKNYLGIAPMFKHDQEYAYLPSSDQEVNYGKNAFSGDVLVGDDATKEAFLEAVEEYQLIHLSTHAGIGSGKNNDGWIAFHSNNKDEKMLTPELLQLDLSASLVVLNGCETGIGEFYNGEGLRSMAHGFIGAGAQSTIMNLWQVNHASNFKLMESFYEELKHTNTPSEALSNAKISYLKSEDVDDLGAHPYYWSAPILLGTDQKILFSEAGLTTKWWIILSGFILFLIFAISRKSYKKGV